MDNNHIKNTLLRPCKRFLNKNTGITGTAWLFWAALVFMVPMHLHYIHILNNFYTYGATFGDGGLFEAVVWHNTWWLKTPPSYAGGDISFNAIHFMPQLMILNFFSYFIDTHGPEFYAGFIASVYALIALGMFGFFHMTIRAVNHIQLAALALVSILFAFNAPLIQGSWYVHVEYAVPAGIMLFLYCYCQQHTKSAIAIFILTLLQREDAGFHFCTVLGVIAAVRYWETRSLDSVKILITYMCAAFVVSAYLWYGTKYISTAYGGRSQSNWELMYSGYPPFHHLTFQLIAKRLGMILLNYPYMWIGLLLSSIYAYYKRNIYFVLGYVACGPWFLLNISAVQSMNGQFTAYYAFPFIVALAWPLVAAALAYGTPLPVKERSDALTLQLSLILVSLIMWDNYDSSLHFGPTFGGRWSSYSIQPRTEHRALTQIFVAKFKDERTPIGSICADDPILSLTGGIYNGRSVCRVQGKSSARTDTLFYFLPEGFQIARGEIIELAKQNNLVNNYCIIGSPICVVTNRTIDQMGSFSTLFTARAPIFDATQIDDVIDDADSDDDHNTD